MDYFVRTLYINEHYINVIVPNLPQRLFFICCHWTIATSILKINITVLKSCRKKKIWRNLVGFASKSFSPPCSIWEQLFCFVRLLNCERWVLKKAFLSEYSGFYLQPLYAEKWVVFVVFFQRFTSSQSVGGGKGFCCYKIMSAAITATSQSV